MCGAVDVTYLYVAGCLGYLWRYFGYDDDVAVDADLVDS